MTPQFRDALQAINKLTAAEKQELFQIVIVQNTRRITQDAVWVGRPFTTLEEFAFTEWPEDESADDFLAFRQEQQSQDRLLSDQRYEDLFGNE